MSLILRGLTVGLLVFAFTGTANAQADKPRKVKWRLAGQLEGGGILLNDAAGGHPVTVVAGVRGSFRPSYLLTLQGGYQLSYLSEGPQEVTYTNLLHRVHARIDLSWGVTNRQFYIGAGPAFFLAQFEVDDGSTSYNGLIPGPGLVYATGYRWNYLSGRLPLAIEFGGQYHHERNDFLVTFIIGFSPF